MTTTTRPFMAISKTVQKTKNASLMRDSASTASQSSPVDVDISVSNISSPIDTSINGITASAPGEPDEAREAEKLATENFVSVDISGEATAAFPASLGIIQEQKKETVVGQQVTSDVATIQHETSEKRQRKTTISWHPLVNPLFAITRLTWEWLTPFIIKMAFKPPQLADLKFVLRPGDYSAVAADRLERNFERQRKRGGNVLLRALLQTFWLPLLVGGLMKAVQVVLYLGMPVNLQFFLDALDNTSTESWKLYVWVVGIFFQQALDALISAQFSFVTTSNASMRARTAVQSLVYKKALRLSNASRLKLGTGRIVNHLSTDSDKCTQIFRYIHWAWSYVLELVVGVAYMFYFLQISAFAGLGILLIGMPLQAVIMASFGAIFGHIRYYGDARLKAVNEVFQGIKIVKFFNWENSYMKRVLRERDHELKFFAIFSTVMTGLLGLISSVPNLFAAISFLVLAACKGDSALLPSIVFPALNASSIIRVPLANLPGTINSFIEGLISVGRVNSFLLEEEVENNELQVQQQAIGQQQQEGESGVIAIDTQQGETQEAIVILDGDFEWELPPKKKKKQSKKKKKKKSKDDKMKPQEEKPEASQEPSPEQEEPDDEVGKLDKIDLVVPKGSLTLIVGAVGSGKSSLLSALIGDMKRTRGEVIVRGSVAYCAQQAWIPNGSFRESILFGEEFDEERYEKVLECCSLKQDIAMLVAGESTEIGESGINISGGQRQRIALARAVYANRDIYLMDDVLSAVDAHVGKHIFEECVHGSLKGRTRVLVTHQLQYLPSADFVVVMDEGRIVEYGTYGELMQQKDSWLAEMMQEHEKSEQIAKDRIAAGFVPPSLQDKQEQSAEQKLEEKAEKAGKLTQDEERSTGLISPLVFWRYASAAGGPLVVVLLLVLYTVTQAGSTMTDWFIGQWSAKAYPQLSTGAHIGIYLGLALGSAAATFFRDWIMQMVCLLATRRLHNKMLSRLMRAPMSFFDTTPLGRILSRFSSDVNQIDWFGSIVGALLTALSMNIATIVLICVALYWFLIPLAVLTVVYLAVMFLVVRANGQAKRLDSISRSPMVACMGQILQGISTIRAFRAEKQFIQKSQKLVNDNTKTRFLLDQIKMWFSIKMDLLGTLISTFTCLVAVIMRQTSTTSTTVNVGLAVSYSFSVTYQLYFTVLNVMEAEASFSAVERVLHFSGKAVPQEPPELMAAKSRPDPSWPQAGKIVFENVSARYRPDLPLVLQDVSLQINAGEKLGIVGRTGSGKSTLISVLMRLLEPCAGRILVDGIPITSVGTKDLRQAITIIPQDPLLFSGTIRSNLDPFDEHDDAFLWNALERAEMKQTIGKNEKGLLSEVQEGGQNFSVGQRQLLCLARAMCRKAKILIMDEASANLDPESDAIVQKTVRTHFATTTRLTIAHRLHTIIDSDRILVMDKAKVAEFDTPGELLRNPDSIFTSLVEETGHANALMLRRMVVDRVNPEDALGSSFKKLKKKDTVTGGSMIRLIEQARRNSGRVSRSSSSTPLPSSQVVPLSPGNASPRIAVSSYISGVASPVVDSKPVDVELEEQVSLAVQPAEAAVPDERVLRRRTLNLDAQKRRTIRLDNAIEIDATANVIPLEALDHLNSLQEQADEQASRLQKRLSMSIPTMRTQL